MRKINLLAIAVVVLLGTTLMSAQSRTWVSGVGNDADPCSRTAPCKTWAGAISKTAPGGEIDALDPGGFGAVTITQAITLDGGGGQVASILASGSNGIVVQAGGSDEVIIRNLRINGINGTGNGGSNGIKWISGKSLHIENCYIFGFTSTAVDIEKADGGKAYISGSVFANNTVADLFVKNTVNNVTVTVDNSVFTDSQFGIAAQDFSKVSVFHSDITGNTNNGVQSSAAAGTSTVELFQSAVTHNSVGLFAANGSSSVNIAQVALYDNTAGIVIGGGGTVRSPGNSNPNSTTGAPNATLTQQ